MPAVELQEGNSDVDQKQQFKMFVLSVIVENSYIIW